MVREERPAERVRYRFGPLERRGLIAGWRGGQIASVAGALVLAVLALRARPSVTGAVTAIVLVGMGVATACWPIAGRTGEQWLPLVLRWVLAGSRRGHREVSPAPGLGYVARAGREGSSPVRVRIHPPGSAGRPGRSGAGLFEGVRLIAAPTDRPGRGPVPGVLLDASARTATAVLSVRGHSFALLGPEEQDVRITGWSRVLASMAREGTDVHRVQWIESCLPDDGSAVREYRRLHAVLDEETAPARSYRALEDESVPVTRRHRVLVAVSIHTARSSRAIRASGGGSDGACAVLLREVASLQHHLAGADVTVDGVLGPGMLASVMRESTAPMGDLGGHAAGPVDAAVTADAAGPGDAAVRLPSVDDGAPPAWPWPMAIESRWDAVRTDATWHATYWIAEWPRVDVTPDFLGPLLFSPLRRTISVTMEPVTPSRAARQVAQARTADIADGELRRRGGFLVTARQTREKEGVERRDVELADGHAQYRFSGYVTVSAGSRQALDASCAAVEQAAGQARMELRLLYGEQDAAFACTLPLARGLS